MRNENKATSTHDDPQKKRLLEWGWSSFFAEQVNDIEQEEEPARIIGVGKNVFSAWSLAGRVQVGLAGKLLHEQDTTVAVGDWVLVKDSVITRCLRPKNQLSRKAAGARGKRNTQSGAEQVIASNLDSVWIVCGVDRDFNPRRLERYLTLVYNCGIDPVIVLTKMDLHSDPDFFREQAEALAFGVAVFSVSAKSEENISHLLQLVSPGKTVALIGSSGAGKSTLINRLLGQEIQETSAVGERVGKGRHTTTSRDLITLPGGGMIIDNPGIREIALSIDGEGLSSAFPDIEEAAAMCRFRDCSHSSEKGCGVLAAVAEGNIASERLASYNKLMNELSYIEQRETRTAARVEKERWKEVALLQKAFKKRR